MAPIRRLLQNSSRIHRCSLLTNGVSLKGGWEFDWGHRSKRLYLADARSQRGIRFLEQLLLALTPQETVLLPNYPNPFNPETWIPYHLVHAANVTLTVYDTQGALVRRLDLGHQSAGYYTDRAKAVYWDGRNESGESVASGVYFYK